jgi:cytochrome b
MTVRDRIQDVFVWDAPTRVFHWLLVLAVAVAYLSAGEDEGFQFTLHVAAGYLVAGLLIFRIVWGVIGSDHARFRDFLPTPQRVAEHLRGLLSGRPRHYVGHNPLGAVAIFAMLGILLGSLGTGLFGGGEELHEAFGNAILIVAAIHVAGVVVETLLTGETLVPAMVHGRKRLPGDAGAGAAAKPAGTPRLLAALAVVVLAGAAGVASGVTPWPPGEAAFEGAEHEADAYEEYEEDDDDAYGDVDDH